MSSVSLHPLLTLVDEVYIINLPFRADRRTEMADQLARIGVDFDHPKITLFEAVRPQDKGTFPSIGCRGCFLSHLGILQDARDKGHDCILILEDDADFTAAFISADAPTAAIIKRSDWGVFYYGFHYESDGSTQTREDDIFDVVPVGSPVKFTHAMMLRKPAIAEAVPYLERMLTRPLGDPNGGPMHVDGAYSWYRKDHPHQRTLATKAQWVIQRFSKTDIHDTGWKEYIPFVGVLRRMRNRLLRR